MAIDLEDAIERDMEVRQARMIAEAARARLVACMSSHDDDIDLAEAQEMLDALRGARVLAEDAEDRMLLHRGLLTSAAAARRAAQRRTAITRSDVLGQSRRPAPAPRFRIRQNVAWLIAATLAFTLAGLALARRCGVRLPLARW